MKKTKITEKFDAEGKLIERVTEIDEGDPIANPVPYVPYIPSWPEPNPPSYPNPIITWTGKDPWTFKTTNQQTANETEAENQKQQKAQLQYRKMYQGIQTGQWSSGLVGEVK